MQLDYSPSGPSSVPTFVIITLHRFITNINMFQLRCGAESVASPIVFLNDSPLNFPIQVIISGAFQQGVEAKFALGT